MSTYDLHIAMRAAHEGIPLACAGDIGFTMGGTRWLHVGEHWFYEGGLDAWMCEGCNVTLVAEQETGMDAATFDRLWRVVVRDLAKVALCVRVKVCKRGEQR